METHRNYHNKFLRISRVPLKARRANFNEFPKNKGITLLLVVVILSALLSISIGIFNVVFGQLQISGEAADSFIALYATDQGIERALYRDRVQGALCADGGGVDCYTEGPTSIQSGGCYELRVSKIGGVTEIVSAGQYRCGINPIRVVKRGFLVSYSDVSSSRTPVVAAENGGRQNSNTTTHIINLPTGISAGNLLLVLFSVDNNPAVTWPAGWTTLYNTSNGDRYQLRYRIANGAEGSSITLTTSSSERSAHTSFRITGHDSAKAPEIAFTSGSGRNPDPPELFPSWGGDDTLWFAVAHGQRADRLVTKYPQDYVNGRNDAGGTDNNGTWVASARQGLNDVSENPASFTAQNVVSWVAATLAIKPAP